MGICNENTNNISGLWDYLLNTKTKKQILSILEGSSEESVRLRSSSPFTGILTENERMRIFEYFSIENGKYKIS